jgi:hypothetical protein
MKAFRLIITLLICFLTNICSGQLRSDIFVEGTKFPVVNLRSTSDTIGLGKPLIGQVLYNSNAQIYGSGADKEGFYTWQSTTWKKINSTMPAGTVVLSETSSNTTLEQKGFMYFQSFQVSQSPNLTYYLFIKK